MESGSGLIETDEKGLNKENLSFHNIEVYGEPTCCAVSYKDKKYDLIGNTETQSVEMNVYKGSEWYNEYWYFKSKYIAEKILNIKVNFLKIVFWGTYKSPNRISGFLRFSFLIW